jgi:hypothetical protein
LANMYAHSTILGKVALITIDDINGLFIIISSPGAGEVRYCSLACVKHKQVYSKVLTMKTCDAFLIIIGVPLDSLNRRPYELGLQQKLQANRLKVVSERIFT